MRDFFKSVQRSFRRKKKVEPSTTTLATNTESVTVGQGGVAPMTPPTEVRSRTWSNRRGSPLPARANSLHRGEESHPGRRFTVTEDMESAWKMGGGGEGGVATRGQRSHRYAD